MGITTPVPEETRLTSASHTPRTCLVRPTRLPPAPLRKHDRIRVKNTSSFLAGLNVFFLFFLFPFYMACGISWARNWTPAPCHGSIVLTPQLLGKSRTIFFFIMICSGESEEDGVKNQLSTKSILSPIVIEAWLRRDCPDRNIICQLPLQPVVPMLPNPCQEMWADGTQAAFALLA